MTAEEFLKLLDGGGTIVSSNACSCTEIAIARASRQLFVDERGFGAVYRPQRAISTIPSLVPVPLGTHPPSPHHPPDPHDAHLLSVMDWEGPGVIALSGPEETRR